MKIAEQEERLSDLERNSRKKEIIMFILQEEDEETVVKLTEDITQIISSLEITGTDSLQEVKRLGQRANDRNRPIHIELSTIATRNEILRNKTKLKGKWEIYG
ncbi:hypothetical protein HHI36_007429 [Cryptolaemus montrouzieri]|uniref:Uncharacterized protein n=1 Tax=Cryptolaemus montrouzieri TaxID=559131 RepID=A0ABD2MPK2_9CUCU